MEKKYQTIVFTLIVGLIVGFLFGRLFVTEVRTEHEDVGEVENVEGENMQPEVVKDTLDATGRNLPEPILAAQGDIVHVKDQQEGSQVFLSRLELTRSGWAAVREIQGGTLGNILGAKRFDAGVYQVVIPVLRSTKAGERYAVVLYTDDGDKLFDFEKDAVIVDSEGDPVSMQFEVY